MDSTCTKSSSFLLTDSNCYSKCLQHYAKDRTDLFISVMLKLLDYMLLLTNEPELELKLKNLLRQREGEQNGEQECCTK